MTRTNILRILCAMVAWDGIGHASQLIAGRDWSVGQPAWMQWLFCAVWFPSWTAYNLFWTTYWLTALLLLAAVARMAASPKVADVYRAIKTLDRHSN